MTHNDLWRPYNIFILDVTWDDITALLGEARTAKETGLEWFRFQHGPILYVADIFDPSSNPYVQAVKCLHTIRQRDHRNGCYRDAKL